MLHRRTSARTDRVRSSSAGPYRRTLPVWSAPCQGVPCPQQHSASCSAAAAAGERSADAPALCRKLLTAAAVTHQNVTRHSQRRASSRRVCLLLRELQNNCVTFHMKCLLYVYVLLCCGCVTVTVTNFRYASKSVLLHSIFGHQRLSQQRHKYNFNMALRPLHLSRSLLHQRHCCS